MVTNQVTGEERLTNPIISGVRNNLMSSPGKEFLGSDNLMVSEPRKDHEASKLDTHLSTKTNRWG